MFKELDILFKATKSRVFDTNGNQKAQTQIDFGPKFLLELEKFRRQKAEDPTWPGKVTYTMGKCTDFLKEAIAQVEKRLPRSRDMFQSLTYLAPTRVLNQTNRVAFKDLPLQSLAQGKEDVIESQYQRILFHPWKEEPVFKDEIPSNPAKFWTAVWDYKREDGERTYKELYEYSLAAFCMPISNAFVERIFSHVGNVKTKLRNRMSLNLLDAILRIRTTLILGKGGCCKSLEVTKEMLDKFNSAEMYGRDEEEARDVEVLAAMTEDQA